MDFKKLLQANKTKGNVYFNTHKLRKHYRDRMLFQNSVQIRKIRT